MNAADGIVTRDDVIAIWPALAKIESTEQWSAAIAAAESQVNFNTWGRRTFLGRIHFTAHLLATGHPEIGGNGAVVASESVGSIHRTYAVTAVSANLSLSATPYGREFQRLQRQLGALRIVVP